MPWQRVIQKMNRYENIEDIGSGAFGNVTKCVEKETGDYVAIKKMKEHYRSWEECLELKEVKSLRKIQHENVVKMKTVFRENDNLYLVFELCGPSLLKVVRSHQQPLPEPFIRNIMTQLLRGLNAVHHQGFFHRDIKPENLLFAGDVLKILDFGLAREIRSRPPYTQYAGTRWYRAPEILLRHPFYNSPVDIWAAGAICAELFIGKPIFQGSSETDQIYKICNILGPPSPSNWSDGAKLAQKMGLKFPAVAGTGLASAIPNASKDAIDFIAQLLALDPNHRPSAKKALTLPFLQDQVMMSLSDVDAMESNPSPSDILSVNVGSPELQRPHAAPAAASPRQRITNSFSHESFGTKVNQKSNVSPTRPIDYRQFEIDAQTDDDIFDGL